VANHPALGKGLAAIMDGSATGFEFDASQGTAGGPAARKDLPVGITSDDDGTLWVNPALLKPNPRQPRQIFDEEKLAELTESVKREGILSPIIIEDTEDGSFYIIAGERRTRAARAAGLEKVPVQLRRYSDSRKLEVALIENIQRTDLTPVEEAEAYMQLMQLEGITQEEVAEKVGKSRSAVANTLRLLKLPDEMRQALAAGEISAGHARALLSVGDPSARQILFKKITSQGLSVRQAEKEAGAMNSTAPAAKAAKPEKPRDPNYADLEQKFIEALGTKVQMKGNWDKGQLVIDYFSQSDLDRIFNKIVGQAGS
jgi:ParB family chromosome partitioning protein